MCRTIRWLSVYGVITTLLGCGGGLTQDDMRRHAISRKSNNKTDAAKAASKPSPAPAKTPNSHGVAANSKDPAAQRLSTQPPTTRPPVAPPSRSATATRVKREDTTIKPAPLPVPTSPRWPSKPLDLVERRQRTIDNLEKIGAAFSRYTEERGGVFSRAICNAKGEPLLSWRVELLPFLGHRTLYDRFDLEEPWDSDRNRALLKLIPREYQSPERFDENTNYQLPVASFSLFGHPRGVGVRRVEDGLENTVVLIEVDDTDAVPWTQPRDYQVSLKTFDSHFGSLRSDGFFAVWGDGVVTRVMPQRRITDLKAIFSYDGGDLFASHLVRAKAEAAVAVAETTEPRLASAPDISATATAETTRATAAPVRSRTVHAPVGQLAPAKLAVPDSRSLDKARKLVRQIFEEDYKHAKTVRDQQALAKSMLKQVSDMPDDPAGQYVLLDIVIQIATQTRDNATAIQAMEEMIARFDVNALETEHGILQQLAKGKYRGRAVNQALVDETDMLIEKAILEERFEIAESLCQIALGAARQLDDKEESTKFESRKKLITEARRAFQAIQRTVAGLEDAEDPKANLEVGKYYCLIRGEWDKGLPLLAKGDDVTLRGIAETELRDPVDATEQVALADQWWQLSSKETSRRKKLRLHAAHWYMRALNGLPQGLLRVKAELRVKQIERDYGQLASTALHPAASK